MGYQMSETRFTDQHEWVRIEGDEATVGITKYAAEQLGDVVFVELPEKGRKVGTGGEAAAKAGWQMRVFPPLPRTRGRGGHTDNSSM